MTITVLEGQSLFDIAVQACGSVEAVLDVASLNGMAITDILTPGSALSAPDSLNLSISEYYRLNKLRPATDITAENMDKLRNEGIDYWALEVDFVVQ
jgi:hypothetical protein